MGFRRYRLGLEWTDSFFKLVEVHQSRGKIRVTDAAVHPLPPGWFRKEGVVEPESVVQAVREALKGKKLRTRKVHIAISGGTCAGDAAAPSGVGEEEASKMGSKKDSPRGGPAVGGSGV